MTDMTSKVVAEISVRTVSPGWYSWMVYAPGVAGHDTIGHSSTPTEALWRAVDAVRCEDGGSPRGRIAVHSIDTGRVAYAPLWAVPDYQRLQWQTDRLSESLTLGGAS